MIDYVYLRDEPIDSLSFIPKGQMVMRNPFAFMKYRIYRRTFSIYIAIMLFVICSVSGAMLYSAHRTGLERFVLEENSSFSIFETKRQSVMTGIDRLFFRIYATRSLEDDFIHFFSPEAEEYVRYRLSDKWEESYLASRMAEAVIEGIQSQGVDVVAKHLCAQGETTGGKVEWFLADGGKEYLKGAFIL